MGLLAWFLEKTRAILALARMESSSFIAAYTGLCFECLTETVWITPLIWLLLKGACAVSRLSLLLCPLPPAEVSGLWVGKELGRDSWLKLAKDILHSIQCHTQRWKWGIEKASRGWEDVLFQGGCFLGTGWARVCLWEAVRDCLCISSPPKACLYIGPQIFSLLLLLSPLSHGGGGSEQAAVGVLSCWPG